MLFRTYGQAVLTLHERHSRLIIALSASDPTGYDNGTGRLQSGVTVTFDNGTGSRHHQLHALGIQTFRDTHSPWQKGGVENAIGRMRRTLPRKTTSPSLTGLLSWCRPTIIPHVSAWNQLRYF